MSHTQLTSSPSTSPAHRKGTARAHWSQDVPTGSARLTAFGLVVCSALVFGFGGWAVTAPLASAAVAHGYVSASGRNIDVQHLEGGIVRSIAVREGDRVKAGETLFELDATAANALRNRIYNQIFALDARAARLRAERDGADALDFPAELRDQAEDPHLASVLSEQEKEFLTKLEGHRREIAILDQQVAALNQQIVGLADQKAASEDQLSLVREEAVQKKKLLDRGLTNRSEYTNLLLSQAQLTGQIGQFGATILSARTQIAEKNESIARAKSRRVEVAASELNEVRAQTSDLQEQLAAAEAVLKRMDVRSPTDGLVVKLNYNAAGSVVQPGQPLAEILPTSEDMIVEGRLTPQEIDSVHVGQPAELRFTALNRLTPMVDASVAYVSPDRLVDPRTEQPYYVARMRIADHLPPNVDRSQIYPGMPVEIYIKTGERTFMEYLLKPIEDSLSRAFREE